MRYVSWAAFYEGPSDALYLDILLPRIIRDLIAREGTELVEIPDVPALKVGISDRTVARAAEEACTFREAFDVIFIHADAGGRHLERGLANRANSYCTAMGEQCNWPDELCIPITPRHETEAWLLADGEAVTQSLGFTGAPADIGLPRDARDAERLLDPKAILSQAIEFVAGRRRGRQAENLFPAIAQRQRLELLRRSNSFLQFEARLRRALQSLRCIR